MELGRFEKMEMRALAIKRRKHFVPAKNPRFLPGEVANAEMVRDLRNYNKHLHRVFYAQSLVDTKPPPMNPNKYIKVARIRADALRMERIDIDNKDLVEKINNINRMGGKVDCFNPLAYSSCSRWSTHVRRMHIITKDNLFFYKRLQTVQPKYPKSEFDKEWVKMVEKLKHMAKYTLQMFVTKSLDQTINEMPSICNLRCNSATKRKRPHCYIDFKIKDGIPLGRIIIELYNDVVPKTCENFLSLCKGTKSLRYKSCKVYSVIKGQYLETGDVTLNNGKGGCSIFGERFPEEDHLLRHSKPGVVSMVPVDKIFNNSKFSITFDAQENLDFKRVAFGRVIKGMKTIYHIQDLGRKVGAPIVPIIIDSCGEIKNKKNK